MPGENDDLRTTLENAFDETATEAGGQAPHTEESVRTETEVQRPEGDDNANADRGDGRTPRGRFAPRKEVADPASQQEAPRTEQQQQPVGDQQQAPQQRDLFARPPQSWRPGAREAWQQLPANVREEVHRRERENARILSETGPLRQVSERINQLQQHFAPALQAEGVDVLTASANLMNLASRLRFGTPVEKAHLAAQIIRNYGVDIMALDAVLSNTPAPSSQQQQPQMLQDPRVDQLMAQLNEAKAERQQRLVETATREVEAFGTNLEFFEDVREDMADLMEMAAKRGVDMSLEQAYERACSMSADISKVLAARAQAQAAGTQRQSTQRAKHAASSVRGTPSQTSTPPATDLRGAIEQAIEQVGGR